MVVPAASLVSQGFLELMGCQPSVARTGRLDQQELWRRVFLEPTRGWFQGPQGPLDYLDC